MCPFFMLSAKHLQRDEKPPPPRVTLVGTSRWSQLKNVAAKCFLESSFEHGHDSNCRLARPPHPIKILLNCFSVLSPLKVLESDRRYSWMVGFVNFPIKTNGS